MQTSPRYQVSYPSADRSDAPDVATHLINIVAGLERSGMYGQGTIASRPVSTVGTPGIQGRFYASLDETPNRLYYDYGTGWFQIGALAAGAVGSAELAADAVTQVKMADNSVGSAEIIDGSVGSAEIADGSVTAGDLAAALKPSQGAGAAAEALRALGTAAGLAAAGTHATQHQPGGADVLTLEGRQINRHRGAAPPGSPSDGDLWEIDIGNGRLWRFIYDSAEITYKWRFVGGREAFVGNNNALNTASAVYVLVTGMTHTFLRSGEYEVDYSGFEDNTVGSGEAWLGLWNNGVVVDEVGAAPGSRVTLRDVFTVTGIAGQNLQLAWHTNGGSPNVNGRAFVLSVKPIRII